MITKCLLLLLSSITLSWGQHGKCDQTPSLATVPTPTEDKGLFHLKIQNAGQRNDKLLYTYTPAQTYVLELTALKPTRPFRWFMITAEDPDVDNSNYEFSHENIDVGTLKTLDARARYSERCYSSIEHVDNSEKTRVEIHWVSPSKSDGNQTVRIRGMVAETNEVWYTGDNLTVMLYKNNERPRDSPPFQPIEVCKECSEARYEVTFYGKWSRMTHPRHYPSKPDENGYTHMVGASHHFNFTLWEKGSKASPGLRQVVEEANTEELEKEIISAMALESGTRTLIRGKRRHHPFMSEPSHSLFRVDRFHHLFSLVVGLRPSPDWFLGTSKFELCTEHGWLEKSEIPLYPWDAGTMDGISYESQKSKTQTVQNVDRVEVGSFIEASPFFQINLNDLQPFALLKVRRLDIYPLVGADCSETGNDEEEQPVEEEIGEEPEEQPEEPLVAEARQNLDGNQGKCYLGDWGDWSPCTMEQGACGVGFRTRTRQTTTNNYYFDYQTNNRQYPKECAGVQEDQLLQYQSCYVEC